MKTKPHIGTDDRHPLLACSRMVKEQNLDGLMQSIRDAEAQEDQELLDLLRSRQRSAHDVLYEKAIGILEEFKERHEPLLALDRPVVVRLAAIEKVVPEEISADLEQQVMEVIGDEPKTTQEIGEALGRGGQSVKAILSRLLASGRLTKRGGLYSHAAEAASVAVEA